MELLAPEGGAGRKHRCRADHPGLHVAESLEAVGHHRRRREDPRHRVAAIRGREPLGAR
ncbi:MAG: hypothetical protein ACOX0O_08475 [Candidatus Methanoculleus thermohydrogenotrophicum]